MIGGIIICPRDIERERFLNIADPVRGQLQFLHTNTVVGKGMLLTPSRVLHFKFKCLSWRCFRAGLLDMFHDRKLPQERLLRDYARVFGRRALCQRHRDEHSHHCHKTEQTAQQSPCILSFPHLHLVPSPSVVIFPSAPAGGSRASEVSPATILPRTRSLFAQAMHRSRSSQIRKHRSHTSLPQTGQ